MSIKRKLWTVTKWADADYNPCEYREPKNELESNLVGSATMTDQSGIPLHAPVIDLDFECELIPSSTPGHHHLYIDKHLTWGHYEQLLTVMHDIGLIQTGWYNNAIKEKQSFVRKPGRTKNKIPIAPAHKIRFDEIKGAMDRLIEDME